MTRRQHTPEPRISNPDHQGALLAMKTSRQLKALQLLHGAAFIDPDTLENYGDATEVLALMRAGPIHHLGPQRHGFSWTRPNSHHNDRYLISLSRHRSGIDPEVWVYSTVDEVAAHARRLDLKHAYIWQRDDADPQGPGRWQYLRANTPTRRSSPTDAGPTAP